MRFDEVIQSPPDTIIRRASWPLHWWLKIIGAPLPNREGSGLLPGLSLLASPHIEDRNSAFSSKSGFARASHAQYSKIVASPLPRISVERVDALPVGDAAANDWERLSAPPIDVVERGPLQSERPYDCAILIDGKVTPLHSLPESAPGYRVVKVLVLESASA